MDFWSPSKYYSDKYKSILNVRWPWQKLMQREVQKKITAITSIHYTDRD
ncbi:MAG: hypothetical protein LBF15_05200 [Candidatus Peribacteria bacterium]|jgi:hypothetical protein|nr:hypothetical protein [Candidatus Peribacteria bacterium]